MIGTNFSEFKFLFQLSLNAFLTEKKNGVSHLEAILKTVHSYHPPAEQTRAVATNLNELLWHQLLPLQEAGGWLTRLPI